MIQLFALIGLFLSIIGLLVTSLWKLDKDPQQENVIRGLALSVFMVGAFIVGDWLLEALFAGVLDTSFITLGGWMIAALLVLLFIRLSDRRKSLQEPLRTVSTGFIRPVPMLKAQRMDNIITSGFLKRNKDN